MKNLSWQREPTKFGKNKRLQPLLIVRLPPAWRSVPIEKLNQSQICIVSGARGPLDATARAHAAEVCTWEGGAYLVFLREKLEKLLEHLHVEFCAVSVLNHGHKVLICAAKTKQMPEGWNSACKHAHTAVPRMQASHHLNCFRKMFRFRFFFGSMNVI